MGEHVQAALGDQLGGQGNFAGLRVSLPHDLVAPVCQKGHGGFAPAAEIVLVHVGGTAVDDGFMAAGQAAHPHLLLQNAGDQFGFHGNGVFPVHIVQRDFQGVDMVGAVGGYLHHHPAPRPGNGAVLALGVDDDHLVVGREDHVVDGGFHAHRFAGTGHAQVEGVGGDQPLAVTD